MSDITPDAKPEKTPDSETELKADSTIDPAVPSEDEQKTNTADVTVGSQAKSQVKSQTGSQVKPKLDMKLSTARWDFYFVLLLVCVTLLRLGYLYIAPLDLSPDESYYWDWSRRLDLSYYSKPPMIAWINAISASLFGISPQAVRIPAVFFATVGLFGMYLCARRLFNAEVAFWSIAACLATPGAAALGLIMTTDVLLICCWCLALYTLWRTLETPRAKLHWWLLTTLLVGLGSLSNQIMLVFPVLLIFYLLFSAEDRGHLKQRWLWLLWGGSLLLLLPLIYWNVCHGWVTFKHTAPRIEFVGATSLDHLKTFGKFVGSQMGLLTPITWLLMILLILSLLPFFLRGSRQVKFLFIFGAIGLLGFSGFSFKQSINPGWPTVFYPAGLILLAAWGRGQVHGGVIDRLRKFFIPGLKLGIALTLIAYLLPFAMELSFLSLGKKDPTYQVKGWQELGQQIGEILQEQPQPNETFIISPIHKYSAAVAFYAPGHPTTYQWPENPLQVSSQYELWPGPADKLGWDALILHNAEEGVPEGLVEIFEKVVDLGEKSIPIGAAGERKYHLWRGENLRSWPK